jgi:hypothetical protein
MPPRSRYSSLRFESCRTQKTNNLRGKIMKDSEVEQRSTEIMDAMNVNDYMLGVSPFIEALTRAVLLLAQIIQEKSN